MTHLFQLKPRWKQYSSPVPYCKAFMWGELQVFVGREPSGNGMKWHLSISNPHRYPTWEEIKAARYDLVPRGLNNDGKPNAGWFRRGISTPKSDAHRNKIGAAQKVAWSTKRQRMPVGSTWIDTCGYIRVKVVPGKGQWKLEHVMAIEEAIGRKLRKGEVVHHIDGDRQNNRCSNLHLCRDHAHHMQIEKQLKELFRELLKRGVVTFSHALGVYLCH